MRKADNSENDLVVMRHELFCRSEAQHRLQGNLVAADKQIHEGKLYAQMKYLDACTSDFLNNTQPKKRHDKG